MADLDTPTDRTDEANARPTSHEWKRTLADLAIGLCLAGMVMSPQIASADPPHKKGDCRPESVCKTSYSFQVGVPPIPVKCTVNGDEQGKRFSICNGCNEKPCPNVGGCDCRVSGEDTDRKGRPDAC